MISIIIPVFNAKECLHATLQSIFLTTKTPFELILIDDCSDSETQEYIWSIDTPEINLRKVFNLKQKWTNYNWNLGASLAKGEYIAILNSDILLSDSWDLHLIEGVKDHTISCPTEKKGNLDSLIEKIDPKMIKGACFMFKAQDKNKLFPIPPQIKHWCGDNVIADRANQIQGVKFTKAVIKHSPSQSAKTVKPSVYRARILADVEAYERLSDRNMKLIKDTLS